MSAQATKWVWAHSTASGARLGVHLHIAEVVSAEHNWLFFVSVRTISASVRIDRRSTQRSLRWLEENGYLTLVDDGRSEGRRPQPQTYRFLMPEGMPVIADSSHDRTKVAS